MTTGSGGSTGRPRHRTVPVTRLAIPAAAALLVVATATTAEMVSAGRFDAVPLLPPALAVTIEALAGAALVGSWWSRRRGWLTRRLPAVVVAIVAAVGAAAAVLRLTGTVTDAYPPSFLLWIGLALAALAALPFVLARSGPARRAMSVAAVPLTLAGAFLLINDEYGVWPTLGDVLGHTARVQSSALRLAPPADPTAGTLVALDPPATRSHFGHRPGSAYLPPAYFTPARAQLPVVVLLAGVPGAPSQWMISGRAVATADAYAAAHGGIAPILVFVDENGSATADTECVDGPQGNAETYLTVDVPAYLRQALGLTPDPARWVIGGFSEGGTCAIDLALAHPDLFGTFIDLAGDAAPTLGSPDQTLNRLFGGSVAAMQAHDPVRLLQANRYPGLTGWFAAGTNDGRKLPISRRLAAAAARSGLRVHEFTAPGGHSWQFASAAFAQVLPPLCEPAPAG